jgi:hypothetical protein
VICRCWSQRPCDRPSWIWILDRIADIDADRYEEEYGRPLFQLISKSYQQKLEAKRLKQEREEEERVRAVERKEARRQRKQQLQVKRARVIKQSLTGRHFSNLLPAELIPTLDFYIEMYVHDDVD